MPDTDLSALIHKAELHPHPATGAWIYQTRFWFEGEEIDHYYAVGPLADFTEADARMMAAKEHVDAKALAYFLITIDLDRSMPN